MYLEQRFRFFRKLPRLLNRLLDLNPVLRLATSRGVSVNPAELGELTVSMLRGVEGPQGKEIRTLVRFLAEEARPDVINLPNSLLISLAPAIKQQMNVPVCCTLQGGRAVPKRSSRTLSRGVHPVDPDARRAG